MAQGRCEFVDNRLRRCPPDRASAVPYGQAGENALRFPPLAHRSAAAHKLHSTAATSRIDFDSGKGATFSRRQTLAYSSRNLSRRPGPSQYTQIGAGFCPGPCEVGMRQCLALIAIKQDDVAGRRLLLAQLQTQANPIDLTGNLPPFQSVPRPPVTELFFAALWKVASG